MSHDLDVKKDGTHAIAYAGEVPWHGFGKKLDSEASIPEWQEAAGLNWSIQRTPVEYAVPNPEYVEGDPKTGEAEIFHRMLDRHVLYRSDTQAAMSVVSSRYQVVQPGEVLEFFRDLVGEQGFTLESAGSLKGGSRIWCLANTNFEGEVTPGDEVRSRLLLATSYDGMMSTVAMFTPIRVVCNNTFTLALNGSSHDGRINVPHSSKFVPAKVKAQLASVNDEFSAFLETSRELAKVQLNTQKTEEFLVALLTPQTSRAEYMRNTEQVKASKAYKEIMRLYDGEALGSDLPGVSGTAWQMLAACSEYADHEVAAKSDDSRLQSAWFGMGRKLKDRALELSRALL